MIDQTIAISNANTFKKVTESNKKSKGKHARKQAAEDCKETEVFGLPVLKAGVKLA